MFGLLLAGHFVHYFDLCLQLLLLFGLTVLVLFSEVGLLVCFLLLLGVMLGWVCFRSVEFVFYDCYYFVDWVLCLVMCLCLCFVVWITFDYFDLIMGRF